MKHYLVEITYTAPLARIEELLPEHRAYLQLGYDRGLLLCSGPMTPRTGGIVIARAESAEAIAEYFSRDPYALHQAATHRIVEFTPVKHQPFLQSWI
ncbi:MAG TPA: YciI family protein [Bacteroidota bacterium]|nr:YciI family protein [Bacteroidota bacterium]